MSQHEIGGKSLIAEIKLSEVLTAISTKQTQYYVLWAGYATVQFTAASFGTKDTFSHQLIYAVLGGVWMFNIGHLSFVLQCVTQINKLRNALVAALSDDKSCFEQALRAVLADTGVGMFFWATFDQKQASTNYFLNVLVACVN